MQLRPAFAPKQSQVMLRELPGVVVSSRHGRLCHFKLSHLNFSAFGDLWRTQRTSDFGAYGVLRRTQGDVIVDVFF